MRFGELRAVEFRPSLPREVTAREALQLSLNLPPWPCSISSGLRGLHSASAMPAHPLILPDKHAQPGLPIALGGVGTSLERMVTLYAALAEGGMARPLLYRADEKVGEGHPLMSPLAAWYVTRILDETPPHERWLAAGKPEEREHGRLQDRHVLRIPRCLGARLQAARYTVASGSGGRTAPSRRGRMGREAAAPILFPDLRPACRRATAPPPRAGGRNPRRHQ